MAYTITPYKRDGTGTLTASTDPTTECSYERGFRNVAVGATLYSDSLSRTVTSKTDENTVEVDSAWTLSADAWEYINPALVFSKIYYVKHAKNDGGSIVGIPNRDSDYTMGSIGSGITREIILSGFIRSTTIADVYKNITILESLADGTQTIQGTCTYTEDLPPRTMYVYITSISWQYKRDDPLSVDVNVTMTECRNRGST